MNLSQEQSAFLTEEAATLNPAQKRILSDRGYVEGKKHGDDVAFFHEGEAGGFVTVTNDAEQQARARGATLMRQVLDYAVYGDFLPAAVEQRFEEMFR